MYDVIHSLTSLSQPQDLRVVYSISDEMSVTYYGILVSCIMISYFVSVSLMWRRISPKSENEHIGQFVVSDICYRFAAPVTHYVVV